MKHEAVKKARQELAEAEGALTRLNASRSQEEMRREWRAFLNASYSFWEALKRGASAKSPSKPWVNEMIALLDVDPVLKFVESCRHEREHGLSDVILDVPSQTDFKGYGHLQFRLDSAGRIDAVKATPLPGSDGIRAEFTPASIRLVEVPERRGRQVGMLRPPVAVPGTLGRYAVAMMSTKLAETERLPPER